MGGSGINEGDMLDGDDVRPLALGLDLREVVVLRYPPKHVVQHNASGRVFEVGKKALKLGVEPLTKILTDCDHKWLSKYRITELSKGQMQTSLRRINEEIKHFNEGRADVMRTLARMP